MKRSKAYILLSVFFFVTFLIFEFGYCAFDKSYVFVALSYMGLAITCWSREVAEFVKKIKSDAAKAFGDKRLVQAVVLFILFLLLAVARLMRGNAPYAPILFGE